MVTKNLRLTLPRSRFGEHLQLTAELGLDIFSIKHIVSATLLQYGNKALEKSFESDGYIIYYINKDRKCSMRFNESCGVGIVEVKNPDISIVIIDFEIELNE